MDNLDPKIVAAVISAVVSIFVFILASIGKFFWEKHFHTFKLRAEHKYEQRKQVKSAISRYKVRLIDAGESLNHRLWNFSDNYQEGWHIYSEGSNLDEMYYLQSFVYRFLSFFAWGRKIEQEMVYLDSTISDSEDLEFIKYLKLFPQMFCDTAIFSGQGYDSSHARDHFFKDDFLLVVDSLITKDGVLSFSEFKKTNMNEYGSVISYIGSISIRRDCLKWYAMNSFHFMLMAFLSKYGYDFQKTSKRKLESLADKTPKNKLVVNISKVLERNHLENSREIKIALKVLKKHFQEK